MKPSWEKVYKANYSRKSKLISFTNSKKTPYYTGCVPQYLPQFPLTVLTMLPQEKKKKNHSGLPQIYHRLSSLYIREKYTYSLHLIYYHVYYFKRSTQSVKYTYSKH